MCFWHYSTKLLFYWLLTVLWNFLIGSNMQLYQLYIVFENLWLHCVPPHFWNHRTGSLPTICILMGCSRSCCIYVMYERSTDYLVCICMWCPRCRTYAPHVIQSGSCCQPSVAFLSLFIRVKRLICSWYIQYYSLNIQLMWTFPFIVFSVWSLLKIEFCFWCKCWDFVDLQTRFKKRIMFQRLWEQFESIFFLKEFKLLNEIWL